MTSKPKADFKIGDFTKEGTAAATLPNAAVLFSKTSLETIANAAVTTNPYAPLCQHEDGSVVLTLPIEGVLKFKLCEQDFRAARRAAVTALAHKG